MRKRELYNKTHNTGLYQDLHEIQDAVFNSALNLINKTTKGEYKYSFCQIGMDESTSLLVFKLSTGVQYAFQIDGDVITTSARVTDAEGGWLIIDNQAFNDESAPKELIDAIEQLFGPEKLKLALNANGTELDKEYISLAKSFGYTVDGDYAVKGEEG